MRPYAVIVLNQPINKNALDAVLDSAALLICADGGANRLYQCDNHPHRQNRARVRIPDAIVGDLDSLDPEIGSHYSLQGVKIIKDPDQYSTDFTKCLKYVRQWATSQQQHGGGPAHGEQSEHTRVHDGEMDVVVLGGLGGRVDQGFSQIHHLFMAENDTSLLQGRMYLLSEQSLSFVLSSSSSSADPPGGVAQDNHNANIIHLQPGHFAENVGILPVRGRILLTTKGLEWDVQDWPTEFGGQVSTSNHIRADNVEIAYEGPSPLFTLELARHFTARGE
jgi:thiamine pyrophosphokinase